MDVQRAESMIDVNCDSCKAEEAAGQERGKKAHFKDTVSVLTKMVITKSDKSFGKTG